MTVTVASSASASDSISVDSTVGGGGSPAEKIRAPRRHRQLALVEDVARPVVKWPGGKTRLLRALLDRMPDPPIGTYIEPFAGGASLFFRVAPSRAVLGDTNRDLIELYEEVARDPSGLHDAVRDLVDKHRGDLSGATYYEVRESWNDDRFGWTSQARAASLMYLNRSGFNGLFRLNRDGRLNVPMGKASPGRKGFPPAAWPSFPSTSHLVAAGSVLSRASLRCADYVDVVSSAVRGDFVYLDPPYLPVSKTGCFAAYTRTGFGPRDHDELGRVALDLVGRGVLVMVSSSDVPGARERYSGFDVHEVRAPRSINSVSAGRGKVGELIMTGGYRARIAA